MVDLSSRRLDRKRVYKRWHAMLRAPERIEYVPECGPDLPPLEADLGLASGFDYMVFHELKTSAKAQLGAMDWLAMLREPERIEYVPERDWSVPSPLRIPTCYSYTTNLFGSSFYTLTGFHGSHVTLGVIWLTTVLILAIRGKLPPEKALNLELAALYWHFVDVVWIVIFPVVYLMK